MFGNVYEDLVEEAAGVEGGFTGRLDEPDNAFAVGRDQKREVGGGKMGVQSLR
jgi:hypothetical protein